MQDIRNNWKLDEVRQLFDLPFNELLYKAATIHRKYFDHNKVQLSTLLSIKTGACPEDCKYCSQSAHYETKLEKEALLEAEKVIEAAKKAKASGASRFCMGAAWRNLSERNIPYITHVISQVKSLGLETCVTLGMADKEQLIKLKEAGLDYYNHNIDTSEEYYSKVITTRKFEDRLKTLNNINEAGLKTCSGGIIGMGETIEDRLNMLITLANLEKQPESVPINKLVKIKGTPLENSKDISDLDFVRIIAIARIMLPKSFVRLSAGRETMPQIMQILCFFAGANSIFYGEKLLTAPNNIANDDIELFKSIGIEPLAVNL